MLCINQDVDFLEASPRALVFAEVGENVRQIKYQALSRFLRHPFSSLAAVDCGTSQVLDVFYRVLLLPEDFSPRSIALSCLPSTSSAEPAKKHTAG